MDRVAQMFITPDEFDHLLAQAVSELQLTCYPDERTAPIRFVHVGEASVTSEACIRLQRPLVGEADTLYLVQHDLRTSEVQLVRLFDRLRGRWNKFLTRPVLGTNIVHGGSDLARDIGFTAGALALYREGWKWKQYAVDNIEFAPDPAAANPTRIL